MPVGNAKKTFANNDRRKMKKKSLKRKIVDEIKQIKAKYRILQGKTEDLTISADKLGLKAEKQKNFT